MEYVSIGIGLLRLLFDAHVYGASADILIEEWVYGRGSYIIHSEITEAQACAKAESRAKLDAIHSFNGEYIASDTFMACKEKDDNVECPLHTFTWSMLDGLISGVRNKTVRATENLEDQRICRVTLEARVSTRPEPFDPNFDIQVRLSTATLRHGDPLTIEVEPTQPMYLNILVEDYSHTLTKIFPNQFEEESHTTSGRVIPSSEAYNFVAEFPSHLSGNDAQEIVHVLGTRDPLLLLAQYSIEDFNIKLLELPNSKKRYVKKAYRLVK